MDDEQPQMTWFGVVPSEPELPRKSLRARDPNPMVLAFGAGPSKAQCGTCAKFRRGHGAHRYNKCVLRGVTHGPGTDHFATWPSCGRYEEVGVDD